MKIYYAHHLWKYGTAIEVYELDLINRTFPNAEVFNPSVSIPQGLSEKDAMELCIAALSNCDAVAFSDLSGVVGRGVAEEVETAFLSGKPTYRIRGNGLFRVEVEFEPINNGSNRAFAIVIEKNLYG